MDINGTSADVYKIDPSSGASTLIKAGVASVGVVTYNPSDGYLYLSGGGGFWGGGKTAKVAP